MSSLRKKALLLGFLASALATAFGAWGMYKSVRAVDFVTVLAGGFGLGVCFAHWVRGGRGAAPATASSPPPKIVPKSGG